MKRLKTWLNDPLHRAMSFVSVLMLVLNLFTVPTSDDFSYSINNGLIDIFQREYHQYMTWTGRSVAHLMLRTMLSFPKPVFDLANAFMYTLMIWLINANAAGREERVNPQLYLLTAGLVFVLVPFPGQTILWETGSCNYLWTICIVLSFLLQYRNAFVYDKGSLKRTILYFFFGLAAGWTNENTGGAMILLLLVLLIALFRRKKIKAWMLTGFLGACLGFLLMIKAPGNAIRSADFTIDHGYAYAITHSLLGVLKVWFTTDGQIILWCLMTVLTVLVVIQGKEKDSVKLSWLYAVCSAAAVLAMVATKMPVYYDRSMFGSTILLVTAVMILFYQCENLSFMPLLRKTGTAVLAVFVCFNYFHATLSLSYTRYLYNIREKWVNTQKQAGNLNPVLPQIMSEFDMKYNAVYGLSDLVTYPSGDTNKDYAYLHGLESVISTPYEKWSAIYQDGDPSWMNLTQFDDYMSAIRNDNAHIILITSNGTKDMDEGQVQAVKNLGIDLEEGDYFCAVIQNGKVLKEIHDTEPVWLDSDANGHYVYLNSESDADYADILIDNKEYTNDNPGLSVIVFDQNTGIVSDSITFNKDHGALGIRYYSYDRK